MKRTSQDHRPPDSSLRLFRWFCHPDYLEDIEGDLWERYNHYCKAFGPKKAKRKFQWEILRLFRPSIIKPIYLNNSIIHPAMIRHNLLISFRGFLRDKATFLINLIGLSTGIACTFLIALWIHSEWQVNRFHQKGDQLHQVLIRHQIPSGEVYTWEIVSALLGPALEQELPEVKSTTMYSSPEERPRGMFSFGEQQIPARGLYAQDNFLETFSFPLLHGNPAEVLKEKRSIVISQAMALKLFGSVQASLGKTLEWNNSYVGGAFTVSGVLGELPIHTTLKFDFLMNIELYLDTHDWARRWDGSSVESFVLLQPDTDINRFNQQIDSFLEKKSTNPNARRNRPFVQPYADRYLYNRYEAGVLSGGRIDYLWLFGAIGLFLIGIACINFMNLSTARASTKMKQIGVKKAVGVTRKSLISQFIWESILVTFCASILASVLVYAALPHFSQLTGKELYGSINTFIILALGIIALLTGILAGSYPAFFLSKLSPLDTLKGKLPTSTQEIWIRKGLVVFQFSLSFIFILAVLVIQQQMEYTQNKNLGFNRENVVYFQRTNQPYDVEAFMAEVRNIPGVVQATNIHGGSIIDNKNAGSGFSWTGNPEEEDVMFMRPQVGHDFVKTLDMEMALGRAFSRDYTNEESKLILNEAALELMELEDPIGKIIMDGDEEKEIVGVVKNFHIKSLHEEMQPCILRFIPGGYNVMVRIQPGREQATLNELASLYQEYHPGYSFSYRFLDEVYQRLYQSELRVASLSSYFSAMAIIISCLGLLGLATYTAEQRKREIGIRKIMGANVRQLVQLLTSDFSRMVGLAILIATPLSFLLAQKWLENFAYKIQLHPLFFVAAGVILLLISSLTVIAQTMKAARINPVECLKE
ncbi:MAG: FtsX-like permease family protein [Bacteroidota bacterium]